MKVFLFALLTILLLAGGGYFLLKHYQSTQPTPSSESLNVSLSGTIKSVSGNSEYQYVIATLDKTVGINSSHLDLSPYLNKKVTVTGQYSGTTLFVDKVTEVQ